ncbi:hypothetical protein D6D06_03610 [Aureobasidium pullulans]|nr:hypothetical protein D6D06_03610 [Aureobasidium pullulans]
MSSISPRGPNSEIAHHHHQIPYPAHFENSLHHILEYPPRSSRDGITIIPNSSSQQPQQGVSIRERDVDARNLPHITLQQLPLSVHDPRRIFASPVPGIRLTHPGGWLEGGEGPSGEEQRAWAREFVEANNISGEQELGIAVQHHMQQNVELAKERMRARYEAQQQNVRVEKEIKTLMDQREMEVKIETRMKEDARIRRENREHKRKVPAV